MRGPSLAAAAARATARGSGLGGLRRRARRRGLVSSAAQDECADPDDGDDDRAGNPRVESFGRLGRHRPPAPVHSWSFFLPIAAHCIVFAGRRRLGLQSETVRDSRVSGVGRGVRHLGHDVPRDSRRSRNDPATSHGRPAVDRRRQPAHRDPEAARRAAAAPAARGRRSRCSGILLLGFGNGGVVWAEQTVPSGLTAVLVSTSPFWMVGVERLMPDGESLTAPACARPRRRVLRNRAAGLAGDSVGRRARGFLVGVVWRPSWRVSDGRLGFGLRAQAPRKDENVLGRRGASDAVRPACALRDRGSRAANGADLRFNARTSAALALSAAGRLDRAGFRPTRTRSKHLPVATVSLYAYINPVIAVLLGHVVLREPFSARTVVACAVVLAGTAIVRTTEAKANANAPARRRAGP